VGGVNMIFLVQETEGSPCSSNRRDPGRTPAVSPSMASGGRNGWISNFCLSNRRPESWSSDSSTATPWDRPAPSAIGPRPPRRSRGSHRRRAPLLHWRQPLPWT